MNGTKVKTFSNQVGAHGYCDKFFTNPPLTLSQGRACPPNKKITSMVECNLWFYDLNDEDVTLIKKFDNKKEYGVKLKTKSGKIYTLTIYR